jgi:hypothetical protein
MIRFKYLLASLAGFLAAFLFAVCTVPLIARLASIPPEGCGTAGCGAARMQIAWNFVAASLVLALLVGTFVAAVTSVALYRKSQR